MALRLGVSRPSVREAISALETMGLVAVRVGSGVYVAPPALRTLPWRFADRCSLRDLYEARIGLEGYAARLAATRIDRAGAAALDRAVDAMATAHERDDVPAMAAADAQFHDLVVALAANPVLAGMVGPVRDMMVESQRLPMALKARLGETLAKHRAVATRIGSGDANGAEIAMKTHIRAAAARDGVVTVVTWRSIGPADALASHQKVPFVFCATPDVWSWRLLAWDPGVLAGAADLPWMATPRFD